MKIYDATNQIAGRLATRVAKDILSGEKVVIVNAEKAVLSGKEKTKYEEYKQKIDRGDVKKGPFYPKYPDAILRRIIRGMIPWHKPKGRQAYKRVKVFIGEPDEFKDKEKIKLEDADVSKLKYDYITLEKLSLMLGAKKRW
ncbi:MAG: 50S ribosomal protein L13 [Candidatus Aenigmarchaeota archaeon]|nr:50S ribosomal protein L13 [Candidatus Aenigmarchaeota archaeon]MCX8190632.1 50S ribosomal protein L13 [Candidatus Aenigmarchaeota archaeon]MDW8160175.1 50S ribosomal protein L13 [Candidatus Aenigmarchaeota archaeon]